MVGMEENSHPVFCPPTYSRLGDTLLNPAPTPGSTARRACRTLRSEAEALYVSRSVEVVDEVPSVLQLSRDYVCANKPLLIRGAVAHWPAITKWNCSYFRDRVGDASVSVSVTPSGYADAPNDGYFVLPEERQLPFREFLSVMETPHSQHGVWYVQKQNSNLTEEFSALLGDLEPGDGRHVSWFSEALGKRPDAVNFWMGDGRAVTSMHKDPYENIYCVISGYKDFLLLPPSDAPWVPYRRYPVASYQFSPPDLRGSRGTLNPHTNSSAFVSGNSSDDTRSTQSEGVHDVTENTQKLVHSGTNKSNPKTSNTKSLCLCCSKTPASDNVETIRTDVSAEPNKSSSCTKSNEQSLVVDGNSIGCQSTSSLGSISSLHSKDNMKGTVITESNDKVLCGGCLHFSIEPSNPSLTVPWVAIDPLCPDTKQFPQYTRASPLRIRVHAGDALYLPSLWFHHVRQSHGCIAVNYWYDMEYGLNYAYYQMVRALTWTDDEEAEEYSSDTED
ncbi:JmjC domain [Trinorchestia longiramus]|nr:JmjC domain [Trinorchestia longiramus]